MNTEILKKYLSGQLPENERASLEKQLQEDPALLEELKFTYQMMQVAEKMELERLTRAMAKRQGPFRLSRKMAVVLLLALAGLVAGIWALTKIFAPSAALPQAMQYYRPPVVEDLLRSDGSFSLLKEAYSQYQSRQYSQSLKSLDRIFPADTLYLQALFLKGHILFNLKEYQASIQTFDQLLEEGLGHPEYLKPNMDNARFTRILAGWILWENDKTTLKAEIEYFIQTAENPEDEYHGDALELLKILQAEEK